VPTQQILDLGTLSDELSMRNFMPTMFHVQVDAEIDNDIVLLSSGEAFRMTGDPPIRQADGRFRFCLTDPSMPGDKPTVTACTDTSHVQ
jgi:hypothetical protein